MVADGAKYFERLIKFPHPPLQQLSIELPTPSICKPGIVKHSLEHLTVITFHMVTQTLLRDIGRIIKFSAVAAEPVTPHRLGGKPVLVGAVVSAPVQGSGGKGWVMTTGGHCVGLLEDQLV